IMQAVGIVSIYDLRFTNVDFGFWISVPNVAPGLATKTHKRNSFRLETSQRFHHVEVPGEADDSFFEPLVLFRGDFSKQSRFRSHRPVLFRRWELEGCDARQR